MQRNVAWRRVECPSWTCERMIGFSLPVNGHLVLVCYCGIVTMDLANPTAWTLDDSEEAWEGGDGYDTHAQRLHYRGTTYTMLGLHGGTPIHRSVAGDEVHLTPPTVIDARVGRYARTLLVRDPSGAVTLRFHFEELSGAWGQVTFSADGDLVIAGMPFDLFVFARETHASLRR